MSKYLKTADYTVKVTPTPTVKPTVQPTATPKVDYPPLPYEMVVVNCNEWVSLRAKPTSNSQQLARVPLGSMVTNCSQANESYASVIYQGMQGYISLNYLAEYVAEPDEYQSAFSSLPECPTYEQFSAVGTPIVEYSFGGYTVSARRSYAGEGEEMMIVCFDPSHKASLITGGAVVVSRLNGEGDRPGAADTVERTLGFSMYLSLAVTALLIASLTVLNRMDIKHFPVPRSKNDR